MREFTILREMLSSALAKAGNECSMLLGQKLKIKGMETREVSRSDYFQNLEEPSFFVGIQSDEEYSGKFFLVFALKDAIALSCTLLGVPPARIAEKKRLAILDDDDVDAFGEIANQVVGSFNAVFKPTLPKKVHLKRLPPQKFIPGDDSVSGDDPIADGDYFQFQLQMNIPGTDFELVDMMIPLSLAKAYDYREPVEDKKAKAAAEAAALEGDDATAAVLIMDDNATERQKFQEMFASSGVKLVVTTHDADLHKVLSDVTVMAVLLGLPNDDEKELSHCTKVKSHFKGIYVPIIMCSRQWTRTGVLKALKYGAKDIMLKPCVPEEVTAKVMKLVNAR